MKLEVEKTVCKIIVMVLTLAIFEFFKILTEDIFPFLKKIRKFDILSLGIVTASKEETI